MPGEDCSLAKTESNGFERSCDFFTVSTLKSLSSVSFVIDHKGRLLVGEKSIERLGDTLYSGMLISTTPYSDALIPDRFPRTDVYTDDLLSTLITSFSLFCDVSNVKRRSCYYHYSFVWV